MADELPEYYRHFKQKPAEQPRSPQPAPKPPSGPQQRMPSRSAPQPRPPATPASLPASTGQYRSHRFMMPLLPDWRDQSVFTLTGPVTDGIQHNVTIMVETDVEDITLEAFAAQQVLGLEAELKGCRILLQDGVTLANGLPARRVIYTWDPNEELHLYQEQLYVLHEKTAYKLTASFTKKTRKTIGPQIERMMLGFVPMPPPG